MNEKTGGNKPSLKKKVPKWGEEGFNCVIQFGCYTYVMLFTKQDNIKNVIDLSSLGKVDGAINCNDQIIVIASDLSLQLKKLTVWHELMHMVLLNNNVDNGNRQTSINDEGFTDTLASRIYEVTQRNPELMRWLMK